MSFNKGRYSDVHTFILSRVFWHDPKPLWQEYVDEETREDLRNVKSDDVANIRIDCVPFSFSKYTIKSALDRFR